MSEKTPKRKMILAGTALAIGAAIVGPRVQGFIVPKDVAPIEKYDPKAKDFHPEDFGTVTADAQTFTPDGLASEFMKAHDIEGDIRPYSDEISRQAGGAGNVQIGTEFHLEDPSHK